MLQSSKEERRDGFISSQVETREMGGRLFCCDDSCCCCCSCCRGELCCVGAVVLACCWGDRIGDNGRCGDGDDKGNLDPDGADSAGGLPFCFRSSLAPSVLALSLLFDGDAMVTIDWSVGRSIDRSID